MPRNTKKDARNWTGKITGIERQIKVESTWYILVGFTTHPNGNHYVSYVMYKNQWWYCNDEDAEQVKDDKMSRELPNAYMLLYKNAAID